MGEWPYFGSTRVPCNFYPEVNGISDGASALFIVKYFICNGIMHTWQCALERKAPREISNNILVLGPIIGSIVAFLLHFVGFVDRENTVIHIVRHIIRTPPVAVLILGVGDSGAGDARWHSRRFVAARIQERPGQEFRHCGSISIGCKNLPLRCKF